jgi:hypothetical protein
MRKSIFGLLALIVVFMLAVVLPTVNPRNPGSPTVVTHPEAHSPSRAVRGKFQPNWPEHLWISRLITGRIDRS